MADSSLLLRMLEPAHRPAAPRPTGPTQTQRGEQPFESKSFDALLTEAKQMVDVSDVARPAGGAVDPAAEALEAAGPNLKTLASIDRIDNPSLRAIVAQRHNPQDDSALPNAI